MNSPLSLVQSTFLSDCRKSWTNKIWILKNIWTWTAAGNQRWFIQIWALGVLSLLSNLTGDVTAALWVMWCHHSSLVLCAYIHLVETPSAGTSGLTGFCLLSLDTQTWISWESRLYSEILHQSRNTDFILFWSIMDRSFRIHSRAE